MDRDILASNNFESGLPAKGGQFDFDSPAEWVGIPIEKHGLGPRFLNNLLQLIDSTSPANHQGHSDRAQILIERRQTSTQELLPIRTGPAMRPSPIA